MDYLPLEAGLQHLYEQKLQTLQLAEKQLPGVFIVHDLKTSSVVYMSERGLQYLQTTLSELQELGAAYHEKYFNPDDAKHYVPKIFGLLQRNDKDEIVAYFQQVRPSGQNEWNWFSSCTKVFLRDQDHRPLFTVTTAIPIDPQHYISSKVERLLEENNFLHKNKETFAALTKREIEILRHMALGQNSAEMAKELFISEATAKTHRRNIKKKINAETTYDVTKFAQAFNII